MGTDIHSIAQVNRDGQWQTVAVGIDGDQRSYNTFAMLANVQNGYGFAGCRTSTGFPVIHEQRGLPEDLEVDENAGLRVNKSDLVCAWDWDGNVKPVSLDYYRDAGYFPEALLNFLALMGIDSLAAWRVKYLDEEPLYLGDHSFSWCTLAELRTFIKNVAKKTETRIVGVVNLAAYSLHKQTGQPYTNWCGMVSPGPRATHVQTSWPVNAAESSRLREIEAALTLVAERTGATPENTRFVYGFDS